MGKYNNCCCDIFTEIFLEDKLSPTEEARPSRDLIEGEDLPHDNTILLQQQKSPCSNTIITAPDRSFQDDENAKKHQEISRDDKELSPQPSCRAMLEGTNYPHARRQSSSLMRIYHAVELYCTVHITVENHPSEWHYVLSFYLLKPSL